MSALKNFTSLSIEFTQSDKASVYYAHLQNVFKQLYHTHLQKQYQRQENLFQKLDQVLFDVFFEYQKLTSQHHKVSSNLKNMLQDCSDLMNECKIDREQLVKVTQDRQKILEKLRQSTNQSLEFIQENQKLYQQLDKMKQINTLLFQKNAVLEDQINNMAVTNKAQDNVVKISKQFEKISNDNVSIQNDIVEILKMTQMYGNASQPLQIMCLAFQQKPNLRQNLWNQVAQKHKNKFQNWQETKQNFYNFNYIDALMLFSPSGKKEK